MRYGVTETGPAALPTERPRRAAATIPAGVSLQGVTKRFGPHTAVNTVDLDVRAGEIVCLLGASGCGKTTLLRLIAGLEVPDAGTLALGGWAVAGTNTFVPPERRGVGLMFQDFALFPHLCVRDNVAFGLTRLGRAAARAEADVTLARLGLADQARAFPHTLSGGQQQRVALARALAPRPSVMLMDEPFSGLDPRLRVSVREDTLQTLRDSQATVIVVTHDAEEAMRLGDRIAIMRAGRIIQTDTPEALYRTPADMQVAAMFSEINALPCRVLGGGFETPFGRIAAPGLADGPALCCLRQHGLMLAASGGCRARVLRVRFLGGEALVELAVPGIAGELIARAPAIGLPGVGEETCIRLDPRAVMVFGGGAAVAATLL